MIRSLATRIETFRWHAVVCAGVFLPMSAGSITPASSAQDAEPQATSPSADVADDYPFGKAARWLAHLKSLHVRAETCDELSPDGIAQSLQQLKRQYPDLTDPDPLIFTELLPAQHGSVEYAFDNKRVRSVEGSRAHKDRELSSVLRIWDGQRGRLHTQYFRSKQNCFWLVPKPDRVVDFFWGFTTYFRRQPPVFWWNHTPEAKKEFERDQGTPADYVLVGREDYHGVECNVFLSAVRNQSDRYYVGVKDGHWYGAKEGIIVLPADFAQTDKLAVEEFFGKKLGENLWDSAWQEIGKILRSLPQEKKIAWSRLNYARLAKNYTPVFEYWFSDFRDLGKSRVIPYREDFLFYGHEGTKSFVRSRRTLMIKEISLDEPLADHLFQEALTEGADVIDEIHKPRLIYTYKAKFTPEEWQDIVAKAKAEDDAENARREKVKQLIGKAAPRLPAGEWLNSEPLTWADLRGKIVVVKFWSIGCAPCYGELPFLRGAEGEEKDPQKTDKKASQNLVVIGVHPPGTSTEEIEKFVKKHKLGAPICIDLKGNGDFPGEFFGHCAVNAMPTSIAVDEEGRILAHGSSNEAIAAATQRGRRIAEKN